MDPWQLVSHSVQLPSKGQVSEPLHRLELQKPQSREHNWSMSAYLLIRCIGEYLIYQIYAPCKKDNNICKLFFDRNIYSTSLNPWNQPGQLAPPI